MQGALQWVCLHQVQSMSSIGSGQKRGCKCQVGTQRALHFSRCLYRFCTERTARVHHNLLNLVTPVVPCKQGEGGRGEVVLVQGTFCISSSLVEGKHG